MITIVSGIPRSGTSLMMQILGAGGMPLHTDNLRTADESNPRGYYECESIKSLRTSPMVIAPADGKAVKVISSLLAFLPSQFQYRVIFMRRRLDEIIASQDKMLKQLGRTVAHKHEQRLFDAFRRHLESTQAWLSKQPNIVVCYVDY